MIVCVCWRFSERDQVSEREKDLRRERVCVCAQRESLRLCVRNPDRERERHRTDRNHDRETEREGEVVIIKEDLSKLNRFLRNNAVQKVLIQILEEMKSSL